QQVQIKLDRDRTRLVRPQPGQGARRVRVQWLQRRARATDIAILALHLAGPRRWPAAIQSARRLGAERKRRQPPQAPTGTVAALAEAIPVFFGRCAVSYRR